MSVGYGSITITGIATITGVDIYYAKNSDPTTPPESGWSTIAPQWEDGKHIWQKTVTTYDNNSQEVSDPVCITGEKGASGEQGRSIVSIEEQYYLSTSSSSATGGSWSSTQQDYVSGKYYWIRSKIVWANPTETTYAPSAAGVLAGAINSANETADSADGKADQALSTANAANSTANAAQTSANSKNTIFYGTATPTANKNNDVWFKDDGNGGYSIRYWNASTSSWSNTPLDGGLVLKDASITNAKIYNLDGNKITANTITANQLATDAIKSANYQASSSQSSPYSALGTFLDLSNGNIYTPNFGVNSVNGAAYVNGEIIATSGTIGDDANNSWTIGTYTDWEMNDYGSLMANGDAFIQLEKLMLSNDRLNTQYFFTDTSDGNKHKLTYLYNPGDNSYYDFGLKSPDVDSTINGYIAGISDLFLYARRHANTIPALETDWEYLFKVDKNGIVYEQGQPLSERYASISGVSGEFLPRSGGTITGNLVVQGTLTATASQANQLTHSLSINGQSFDGSANVDVGTIGVGYGGTGRTSWTANRVMVTNASGLIEMASGNSGQLLKSNGSSAPSWVSQSDMTVGRATADANGDIINSTYAKLSGATFTGAVTFSDELSADSATLGDTTIDGDMSVTGTLYGAHSGTTDAVSFTRNLTSGTKVGTITINGTATDMYAPTNTNTTYTFANGTNGFTVTPSGGTAQTVTVTPSITNNVTGSGTNGYIAKFNGTNTITNLVAIGSGNTTFLRNDGTWATPSDATQSTSGYMSASDKTKLDGVATGAEVNQNAFSKIVISTTTIEADTKTDTLTLIAGSNITLTPDATNDKVTIAATDTTYSGTSPISVSNGTISHANSGVTAASKGDTTAQTPTWGGTFKVLSGTVNATGHLTSFADHNVTIPDATATTASAGLMSAEDKSKLNSINISDIGRIEANSIIGERDIDVSIEDGIATIGHSNSITAGTASGTATSTLVNGGSFNMPTITYDGHGHITAKGTTTITLPNITTITGNAGSASKLSNTTAIGSSTLPVYFTANGVPLAITSIASLNGTATAYPEFYAPTGAGTSGQVLTSSGSGAPGWTSQSSLSVGSASSATKVGVASIWMYPESNSQINFGGTNTGTTLYFGYASKDSRPIPTKFIFGGSTGSADLQAKTVYLGSGTSSYVSSTSYTGNAATATQWASAQKVYVTLGTASTTTTIQGGSTNAQTIGVNGTLGIGNGGTGLTSSPSMLTNLGSTTAANVLQASPRPGVTGTLGVGNGGTGQTTGVDAANYFLNSLSIGTSTPSDNDYYISQYVNGGTTTTTYHRRSMSALYSYIKGKTDSVYVALTGNQTIAGTKTFSNQIVATGGLSASAAISTSSTITATGNISTSGNISTTGGSLTLKHWNVSEDATTGALVFAYTA